LGRTAYPAFLEDKYFMDNKKMLRWFNLGEDAVCEIDFNNNCFLETVEISKSLRVRSDID
jgi:hypothetical protein